MQTYFKSEPFSETYVSKRERRSISNEEMINMLEAEKRLVSELGNNVCIYPRVCLHHAEKARKSGSMQVEVNWDDVFK